MPLADGLDDVEDPAGADRLGRHVELGHDIDPFDTASRPMGGQGGLVPEHVRDRGTPRHPRVDLEGPAGDDVKAHQRREVGGAGQGLVERDDLAPQAILGRQRPACDDEPPFGVHLLAVHLEHVEPPVGAEAAGRPEQSPRDELLDLEPARQPAATPQLQDVLEEGLSR